MIRIKELKKSYGGRTVLDIGPLTFEDGKIYALMGANGSGKSTLLRILAGAVSPDFGEAEFLPAKPVIGYLPQKPYAFALTVLKNVELALPRGADKSAAADALARLGMESLLAERGDALSGGETARMSLARLIASGRDILLLDEPAAAADIAGAELMETAIRDYRDKTGCIVVMSTHSPAEALRLCDETVFLENGAAVESGPTKKLINKPESAAMKRFLTHWRI